MCVLTKAIFFVSSDTSKPPTVIGLLIVPRVSVASTALGFVYVLSKERILNFKCKYKPVFTNVKGFFAFFVNFFNPYTKGVCDG